MRDSYRPLSVIIALAKSALRLPLFALSLLGGCNLPPNHDDMAVEYQYYGELLASLRTGPLHEAIAVGTITAHPAFAPRAPSRMDAERVRAAVEESLHRTELLAVSARARYRLDVELLRTIDQQIVADLIVTATIRYTLREIGGATWYQETFVSDYSIDATDEPLRLTAWELAYAGAMRNNLTALLRVLSAKG